MAKWDEVDVKKSLDLLGWEEDMTEVIDRWSGAAWRQWLVQIHISNTLRGTCGRGKALEE